MHLSIRNIIANFGWLVSGRAVAAVLSLAYLAIATRALGPIAFGHFALILSAAQAVSTLVTSQTWQIVVQYGHRWLAKGDRAGLARLVRGCCILDLTSAVIGALLMTGALILLGPHFGLDQSLIYSAILFGWVLLITIRSTATGILRLHDRFARAAAADAVTPSMRFIGAIAVWLIAPSVQGFLIAWAAAEIVTAIVFWIAAAKTGELADAWHARVSMRDWAAENEKIISFASTTNLGSTLGLAGKQLAALLVGLYVGPAAAGGYRLTQQVAQGLTKISQMLSRATFPELVRLIAPGGTHEGRKLLKKMTYSTGATALALFLLIFMFGRILLWVIGGEIYVSAYPILLILGAAGCVDLAATIFEPALMAAGHATRALLIRAVSTTITVALMIFLLGRIGLEGAAWAVLAGSVASAIMLGATAFRRIKKVPKSAAAPSAVLPDLDSTTVQ